jgi:hypothetical protein
MKLKTFAAAALTAATLTLTGCSTAADVASQNNQAAADNFEINRRIVFYNVRTDTYEKVIEGRCSLADDGNQLEVICRTGENEYLKHFQGKGGDFTYFVEQLDENTADSYHYRVIIRPQTIVPAPELDWAN